jgi:hypothetical protein
MRVTLPPLPTRTRPRLVTGSLVELREQTVSLRRRRDTVIVALDSVLALEVSRGRETRERTGALVGGALGLIAGFGVGHLRHPAQEDPTTGQILAITVIGGFVGTGLGVVVGRQIETDRWVTVRF